MANRTQRRKEDRARRKATRQIPPEVKARIAEIQRGGGSGAAGAAAVAAAAPPPTEEAPNGAAEAPPSPPTALPGIGGMPLPSSDGDPAPGAPADFPPAIRALMEQAQAAQASEGAETGGKPGGARTVSKARSKRFVDLEKELAILLTLPAPMFEGAGDDYCALHFSVQGPLLANRLTAYAETNPATAQLLERIVSAGGFAVVAMAIFSYALPPALHHGLPAPEGLRKMYHVPHKEPKPPVEEGADGETV